MPMSTRLLNQCFTFACTFCLNADHVYDRLVYPLIGERSQDLCGNPIVAHINKAF